MTEDTKPRRTRKPRGAGKVVDISTALAEANAVTEEAPPANQDLELPGMPPRPDPRFPAIDGIIPDRWGIALAGSTDYPEHDAPKAAELLTHGRCVVVTVDVVDDTGVSVGAEPLVFTGRVADIGHPTKKGKRIGRTVVRMVKIKVQA